METNEEIKKRLKIAIENYEKKITEAEERLYSLPFTEETNEEIEMLEDLINSYVCSKSSLEKELALREAEKIDRTDEFKKERALKILKGLTQDLETLPLYIMRENEDYYEMIVRVLKARLENEVWNGIEMSGIPEIDEQVKSGLTYGKFGHYPGSKMGGKWGIDNNEVWFKHTTYYDVYDPADYDEPLCDYPQK